MYELLESSQQVGYILILVLGREKQEHGEIK